MTPSVLNQLTVPNIEASARVVPALASTAAMPRSPPVARTAADGFFGELDDNVRTPPSASDPNVEPCAPRSISTVSRASAGRRVHVTQDPNPSVSGTPSSSTSPRLAPDAESPRMVMPCVVGFDAREVERRNSENPDTTCSASSSVTAGIVASVEAGSTVVPVVSRRQDSADALPSTRIDSRITAGVSVIAAGDAATCWRSVAKPGARTSMATGSSTSGSANSPRSFVVAVKTRCALLDDRAIAPGTGTLCDVRTCPVSPAPGETSATNASHAAIIIRAASRTPA